MQAIRSIDYGMMLLAALKKYNTQSEFMEIGQIAKKYRLPASYLEKIAQRLKQAGILESRRGTGGGYRITKHSNNISIETLISIFQSPYQFCPITRSLRKTK